MPPINKISKLKYETKSYLGSSLQLPSIKGHNRKGSRSAIKIIHKAIGWLHKEETNKKLMHIIWKGSQ